MRIPLAALAVVAVTLTPMAPSHGVSAEPCPAPYVGVVVYRADGTPYATVCVDRSDANDLLDRVRDYVGELQEWLGELPPRCWWVEGGIMCDGPYPPPLPR